MSYKNEAVESIMDQLPLILDEPSVNGLLSLLNILRSRCPEDQDAQVSILGSLKKSIEIETPPSIVFPGCSKSYIQLPSINLEQCRDVYTLSMWIRVECNTDNSTAVNVSLFRCRSPQGGVECLLNKFHGDGRCDITINVYSDSANNGHRSDKCFGTIFLTRDSWHLISFTHNAFHGAPLLRCYVDGDLELEHEMLFPFHFSPTESLWSFGANLCGEIASVVLCGADIPESLERLHYEGGPLMSSLDTPVTHPQGSFDSGFSLLGTQLTKGHDAYKASHSNPVFVFTAKHFMPNNLIPYVRIGKVNTDHIEMTNKFQELEIDKVPFASGGCHVSEGKVWSQVWLTIGGPSVLLYIISCFTEAVVTAKIHGKRIIYAVELLSSLLGTSADFRDFFLQEHGFHVLAFCLSKMHDKKSFLNASFVDLCFDLVKGMRTDGVVGDGLIASLQGLLLNFRLWGGSCASTKTYLLQRLQPYLMGDAEEALCRSIGVQRLLDMIKQHCDANDSDNGAELMEAAHMIVARAMNAALQLVQPTEASEFPELQCVLSLLEETQSNQIAESMLRMLSDLQSSFPRVLSQSLEQIRFYETTALRLLCDSSIAYSPVVRRSTLFIVLWGLDTSMADIPHQLFELRHSFHNLNATSSLSRRPATDTSVLYSSNFSTCTTIKQLMKTIEKTWVNSIMLMTEMKASISQSGHWSPGVVRSAAFPDNHCKPSESGVYNKICSSHASDVYDLVLLDGPLGPLNPVVIVPFLAAILPNLLKGPHKEASIRDGLEKCQRALMSLSVILKTNEVHTCLLSLLPDISWIKQFLVLVSIGEEWRSFYKQSLSSNEESFVVLTQNSERETTSSTVDIANTCTELALDSLTQVIIFKIWYHGESAWDSILIMLNLLRTEPIVQDNEIRLCKRICTLLVQKLSRLSNKQWPSNVMTTISNLIIIIEENQFCGNDLVMNREHDPYAMRTISNTSQVETHDLLGLQPEVPQMHFLCEDERQLLFFLFDLTASIRRSGEKHGATVREVDILLPILRTMMGCLTSMRDDAGDRLCTELLAIIAYVAEHWNFLERNGLKRLVMAVLGQMKGALKFLGDLDQKSLVDRYSDLVVTVAQFFVQLRFVYSEGQGLPLHVVSTVEKLSVVEGCNDSNAILSLLNVTSMPLEGKMGEDLASSGVISFSDEDDDIVAVNTKAVASKGNFIEPNKSQNHVVLPIISSKSRRHNQSAENFHLDVIEHENELHRKYLSKWLEVRRGIMLERIDTERARYLKALDSSSFSDEATSRFWNKVKRKIEAEIFSQSHHCEWKLGVAHEGYFPSRKRLVLRPRFVSPDALSSKKKCHKEDDIGAPETELQQLSSSTTMSADELQALLAASAQHPGVLVDVHSVNDEIAGTGWGIVGEDDSEEGGFGVVGLAGVNSNDKERDQKHDTGSTEDVESGADDDDDGARPHSAVDDVGDMDVNTGPCYSGTRRFVRKDTNDRDNAVVHEADVVLISASGNHLGHMTFTCKEIYFVSTPTSQLGWEADKCKDSHTKQKLVDSETDHFDDVAAVTLEAHRKTRRRKWSMAAISAIYLRRYRLRDSSIEVFFSRGKHRSFFVDFGSSKDDVMRRNEFVKLLMENAPSSAIKEWPGMSMSRLLGEHGIQQRWLEGELSNFDYLMALNTLSGRSYNDLCQYPVFPWVLSQYTESTIDLKDPSSFRDLSKPMGALNADRLEQFIDRFESFRDGDLPPFMYGSHYSTMVGVVLHFLVRLQPFASLHKKMQGGAFDVADRLFASIPRTWEHNTTMLSEVKELTPEFYSLPAFLRNVNGYDFGCTQNKDEIGDVELPPWAESPEEFIRINREALESDYVSSHLHEWIDLIFGYKQRGPQAVEANNVFYYLTYYGAVNRSLISDEATKKAIDLQIAHFGQCPMELFRFPHPQKTKTPVPRPLRRCFDRYCHDYVAARCPEEELSIEASCTLVNRLSSASIVELEVRDGLILCVLDNGVLEAYRFGMSDAAKFVISHWKSESSQEERDVRDEDSGAGNELGNLISFEDFDYSSPNERGVGKTLVEQLEGGSGQVSPATAVSTPPIKMKRYSSSSASSTKSVNFRRDVLIGVEKEYLHFDKIQRVPLLKVQSLKTAAIAKSTVHISRSSGLIFCYGRMDGGVSIRQIASKQARVLSGGDFHGHTLPVLALSSDTIIGGTSDVVCSCDGSGKLLVWKVSRLRIDRSAAHSSSSAAALNKRYVISRRPLRQFYCSATPMISCDISWNLGVVVGTHGAVVSIFSIERNELFSCFEVTRMEIMPDTNALCCQVDSIAIRQVCLSDEGFIVLHLVLATKQLTGEDAQHALAVFTVNGHFVSSTLRSSGGGTDFPPITFLAVPGRSTVAVTGHSDGSVTFFDSRNLDFLHRICPHDRSLMCIFGSSSRPPNKSQASEHEDAGGVIVPSREHSPVLTVRLGPDAARPSVMCVTTASGGFYVCALPDFVSWEKMRSQSTLAQLVNAPIQAVRGSLQQVSALASDNAGLFAQNAKSYADDALSKINKSKLVKGVYGLFGSGKS